MNCEGTLLHVGGVPVSSHDIIDSVGAGDTFIGAFIYAQHHYGNGDGSDHNERRTLWQSLAFANQLAAHKLTRDSWHGLITSLTPQQRIAMGLPELSSSSSNSSSSCTTSTSSNDTQSELSSRL
jgi:hypothetical protein